MELVVSVTGKAESVRVTQPCAASIVEKIKNKLPPIEDVPKLKATEAELAQAQKEADLFRDRARQATEDSDRNRLLAGAGQLDARVSELQGSVASYRSRIENEQVRRSQPIILSPELRDASQDLDDNAVIAVMQWEFKPATSEGKPTPHRGAATVNFNNYAGEVDPKMWHWAKE